MALLIAAVVVYGFGRRMDQRLIHPAIPRPFVLYIHAAVFSAWVLFLVGQTVLVRTHNVRLHRRIGVFGAVFGAVVAVLGIWTAIAMSSFNTVVLHRNDAALALLRSFYDIAAFVILFALAVYLRKKPEFHRRLTLVAVWALTDPAFSRFPDLPIHLGAYQDYGCLNLLLVLGAARDLVVNRSVHRVYLYVLPAFVVCQVIVVEAIRSHSPLWLRIAHAILD